MRTAVSFRGDVVIAGPLKTGLMARAIARAALCTQTCCAINVIRATVKLGADEIVGAGGN